MNNMDMHNIVGIEKASNIIKTNIKHLMSHPEDAFNMPSIILRSSPGCGKSTIVKNIANELGIGFVDVRLGQMDRCDLSGIPSVENGKTKWNIPVIWPQDQDSSGILFFDEITGAPMDVQIAAYSMILDRRIPNTDYVLPSKWLIVAAGNLDTDRAGVKSMSSALANRFMHFDIEANVEDWLVWGVANNIHPSITGYVNYRPTNLLKMDGNQNLQAGWPSPRSWERVSQMISMFNQDEDVLRSTVYGLIGKSVGTEFMEFYRLQSKFDNVLEILTNPDKEINIPTKADEKCAFYSAVSYLLWNGSTSKDDQIRLDGFYRILEKSTTDFGTMLIKLALAGNKRVSKLDAIKLIATHKEYTNFRKRFQHAFNNTYSLDK